MGKHHQTVIAFLLLLHVSHCYERGHLRCRHCEPYPDRSQCYEQHCTSQKEICGVRALRYWDGTIRYWEGCVFPSACNNGQLTSHPFHSATTLCAKCCNSVNCNGNLCHPNEHVYKPYPCYKCQGVGSFQHCGYHESCSKDEICVVRAVQYGQDRRLYGGCLPAYDCRNGSLLTPNPNTGTYQVCGKCCHGEYCNRNLCDATKPVSKTYPCLNCYGAGSYQQCGHYESCSEDEMCMVRAVRDGQGGKQYYGGCVKQSECRNDSLLLPNPHQGTYQVCGKCCHGDNCNRNLCHSAVVKQTSCVNSCGFGTYQGCRANHDLCDDDEICIVRAVQDGHVRKLYGGCVNVGDCRNGTLISHNPHYGTRQVCGKCCHGEKCNQHLCDSKVTAASQTTSMITSTNPTMSTTVVPTTTETPTTTTTTTTPSTSTNIASTLTHTTSEATTNSQVVTHSVTDTKHDLICLSCYNVSSIADCQETEPCHINQMCSLNVVFRNGRKEVSGRCVPEYGCNSKGQLLINDEGGDVLCGQCCRDDYCNRNLCKEYMTTTPGLTTTKTAYVTTTTDTVTTRATTTTTTVPTSAVVTTTTQDIATTVKQDTVDCEVCDGGLCGRIPGNDPTQKCPGNKPYCMNIVKNTASGQKTYTKRCANGHDCQIDWWELSSDQTTCTDFKPTTPYFFDFTCSYCCVTPGCNKDIFPAWETLFQGKD